MARQCLLQAMQSAIVEEMQRDRHVVVFGEDVRVSVFGATRELLDDFGHERVLNTPISEQTIIGTALGAAAICLRPIVDLMTGNFFYTGMDQIANQSAKLPYMTGGQICLALVLLATTGGRGRQRWATFRFAVPGSDEPRWAENCPAVDAGRCQRALQVGHPRRQFSGLPAAGCHWRRARRGTGRSGVASAARPS